MVVQSIYLLIYINGDFAQLDSIEPKHYDVINCEVFADICDRQISELSMNFRAQNDPNFAELLMIKGW